MRSWCASETPSKISSKRRICSTYRLYSGAPHFLNGELSAPRLPPPLNRRGCSSFVVLIRTALCRSLSVTVVSWTLLSRSPRRTLTWSCFSAHRHQSRPKSVDCDTTDSVGGIPLVVSQRDVSKGARRSRTVATTTVSVSHFQSQYLRLSVQKHSARSQQDGHRSVYTCCLSGSEGERRMDT